MIIMNDEIYKDHIVYRFLCYKSYYKTIEQKVKAKVRDNPIQFIVSLRKTIWDNYFRKITEIFTTPNESFIVSDQAEMGLKLLIQ